MIKMLEKFFFAIKKYLFKDTKYFFMYVARYFQSGYTHACKFHSEEGFVALLEKGKSIIRLGDGEIGLLHYLPIHYQKWSNDIRNDFLRIIRNYSDSSPYIIMIPLFVNHTNRELRKIGKFQCWMPLKLSYDMFFNKEATYFDQHVFYRDGKYEKLVLPYLKKKRVLVVTNERNEAFLRTTELNEIVHGYVRTPDRDAYEERNHIRRDIIEKIRGSGMDKSAFVVIMAAGLSKTIIYDLSNEGYQLLDIGKGLESYYKKESIEYQI